MADLDSWDAEDFEPELPSRQVNDDKWEGEDEDDAAKMGNRELYVNEEDADEEGETKDQPETQAYQRPKKKPLSEKLAEKEAQLKKEQEEKKAKPKEERREMSAEERQAEKERIKKIQEQESLSLAKGLFDMKESSLDQMTPLSDAEFDQFGEALKTKIEYFKDSEHYSAFVVQLIGDLSLTLSLDEVKKLGISLNTIYYEKERQRKETEKKKKKKSKASIKVDRADDLDLIGDATGGGGYFDEEDII